MLKKKQINKKSAVHLDVKTVVYFQWFPIKLLSWFFKSHFVSSRQTFDYVRECVWVCIICARARMIALNKKKQPKVHNMRLKYGFIVCCCFYILFWIFALLCSAQFVFFRVFVLFESTMTGDTFYRWNRKKNSQNNKKTLYFVVFLETNDKKWS